MLINRLVCENGPPGAVSKGGATDNKKPPRLREVYFVFAAKIIATAYRERKKFQIPRMVPTRQISTDSVFMPKMK